MRTAERTGQTVCIVGALAAMLTMFVAACRPGLEEQLTRSGMRPAPTDEALAWLASSGEIIFQHHNKWVNSDGTSIRVLCNGTGVYAIGPDGTERPVLVGPRICEVSGELGRHIGISPDGRHVALAGSPSGLASEELRRVDLVSGVQTMLSPDARFANAVCPRWSPDGSEILLYAEQRGTGSSHFYLVSADRSVAMRTVGSPIAGLGSCPAWSPEGDRFVGAFLPDSGTQYRDPGRLVVVDTLGQTTRIGEGYQPAWAPRGDRIAYIATTADSTDGGWVTSIMILDAGARIIGEEETQERILFAPGLRMRQGAPWGPLVWAPDGTRLAFSRVYDDGSQIWSIRLDGTDLMEITGTSEASD